MHESLHVGFKMGSWMILSNKEANHYYYHSSSSSPQKNHSSPSFFSGELGVKD